MIIEGSLIHLLCHHLLLLLLSHARMPYKLVVRVVLWIYEMMRTKLIRIYDVHRVACRVLQAAEIVLVVLLSTLPKLVVRRNCLADSAMLLHLHCLLWCRGEVH